MVDTDQSVLGQDLKLHFFVPCALSLSQATARENSTIDFLVGIYEMISLYREPTRPLTACLLHIMIEFVHDNKYSPLQTTLMNDLVLKTASHNFNILNNTQCTPIIRTVML